MAFPSCDCLPVGLRLRTVFAMAGERTFPILPCRELDDVLRFYEVLGFDVTFRQSRPNAYAVVRRDDLHLHFAAIVDFEAESSYGSVIVVVPDADALYREFADRLRAAYGKLPSAGIPRILRPRLKRGTVGGFSVVDPGGNWLRFSRAGDTEDAQEPSAGLALVLQSAARLGDAKGDHATAARMLDKGLVRHADAPATERVQTLVYRADLALRMGDPRRASDALAEIRALDLDHGARAAVAAELATAAEIESDLQQ